MLQSCSSAAAGLLLFAATARAEGPQAKPSPSPAFAESLQVTATRVPEDIDDVPASIQTITGQELLDRGATDLKSALALAAGVDVAPGGDGGPASSVPEFWGLREFDAFLLVVDGVPWGGTFNPALSTLDLRDVDHVEVQRGPAPVMYGATSFVGVVQVVRRAPGEKGGRVAASGGSHGSGRGSASAGLPSWAGFASSLSADLERVGFEDDRTSFTKGHLVWRNRKALSNGAFSFDLDGTILRQEPASPTPREGPVLSPSVPLDSNQNPADAHLDENRFFARLGYDRSLSHGTWGTTLSFTRSTQDQLRGFLAGVTEPPDNAVGFRADIGETDLYFDTHFASAKSARWRVVAGLDYLFGNAEAEGDTFDYSVGLDGSTPEGSIPLGEKRGIHDKRNFAGLYGNVEWTPLAPLRVEGGLRLNLTKEERGEGEEGGGGGEAGEGDQENFRPSGAVGVTWTAWQKSGDRLEMFGNYKNTFKPAAIDFNLAEGEGEEEGGILDHETSNSYEAGAKAELLQRALRLELAGFWCDFSNLVISQSIGGLPALTNAGNSRLKGVELSVGWRIRPSLWARGSWAYHDARFRDFLTEFDGVPTELAGKRLEMSPHQLAALALTWAPEKGLVASMEMSYVGDRYLNKRNTALAESYATLAASVAYRKGRWELRASGRNLTDRRDPVAESELGDAQYYRLFPRRFDLGAYVRF
jgi:iron complex outermembrane receptor protein